ncbi:hypothetical protein TMatcc_000929 [Talaromyces marneffei ATCC 18224]
MTSLIAYHFIQLLQSISQTGHPSVAVVDAGGGAGSYLSSQETITLYHPLLLTYDKLTTNAE